MGQGQYTSPPAPSIAISWWKRVHFP